MDSDSVDVALGKFIVICDAIRLVSAQSHALALYLSVSVSQPRRFDKLYIRISRHLIWLFERENAVFFDSVQSP